MSIYGTLEKIGHGFPGVDFLQILQTDPSRIELQSRREVTAYVIVKNSLPVHSVDTEAITPDSLQIIFGSSDAAADAYRKIDAQLHTNPNRL